MPPVALRPRSTTEIIDAAVSLLRQHYLELVTASAIFTVPLLIASFISGLSTGYQPAIGTSPLTQVGAVPPGAISALFLFMIIGLILGPLGVATTVVIVSDNYLGREVTIAGAISRAFSRVVPIVITGILQGIMIGLGFVLFIIPGFFCIAWYFAAVNIVMVEGKGPTEALSRGRALARGSVGRILGTLILAGLLVIVVSILINLVLGALIGLVHTSPQLTGLVGNLVSILIYPFFTVVSTVLYFDLRIRKEGLDLELMAKELGVGPPGVAA